MQRSALTLALVLGVVGSASAQPQEPQEGQPAPEEQPAPPAAPASDAPPPVLVVVLPGPDMAPEPVFAIRDAVVAGLSPHVRGRDIRALEEAPRLVAILECQAPECIGAQLAEAGAAAGVLVRIQRPRRRGPVEVTLQVVDPVTGAGHGEPLVVELAAEAETAPAPALAEALTSLGEQMPGPPPRTTLLLAVNIDGATVRIDGEEAGTTPMGPMEIAPGPHTVTVLKPGFETYNRQTEVAAGENSRMNIDLTPSAGSDLLLDEEGDIVDDGGDQPLYKKWYLWAGVGGAVVVGVVVGVAVAAAGGGSGNPDGYMLPPIQ